jgi:hypothetical protein
VKNFSEFVTFAAAATLTLAGVVLPAAAADRPKVDGARSGARQSDAQTGSPHLPQTNVHADYHIDARVGGTDRGDRFDPRAQEDPREERRDRWTPGAERYTRPPQHWSR